MSKGSGAGGGSGRGSGNTSGRGTKKVIIKKLSRFGSSGKALQGLIAGKGGIAKSVGKVDPGKVSEIKSSLKGLSKSAIQQKSNSISTVSIRVSHAYRSQLSGGGTGIEITSGAELISAFKSAGASTINATITEVGKRGAQRKWTGHVKL